MKNPAFLKDSSDDQLMCPSDAWCPDDFHNENCVMEYCIAIEMM
jgi:hypothetical protein